MPISLEDYKKQFFHGAGQAKIHMNNAGLAPISWPAAQKIKNWAERFYQEGFYTDHDYMEDVAQARGHLARLIGCEPTELAFFQSTAGAVSQVAFGFGLKKEDEVVLWDQEYSSNLYPWQEACQRVEAKLVMVPSLGNLATPIEGLLRACTKKTKIVSLSWVQFQTGARSDVPRLVKECHARGIFVFVDVMQGLGLHEFHFKDWAVDAVGGGSHKWLTSPVGVGFLALRLEHLQKFKPLTVGSATYGSCDDPASLECLPKKDVSRFEAGSKQVLEITALGSSCNLILEVGVKTLEQETLRLSRLLRHGLERQGFYVHSPYPSEDHQSAIVNFSGKNLQRVQQLLQQHPVNFALRGPGLRLSPHAFNTDDEVQTILRLLEKV